MEVGMSCNLKSLIHEDLGIVEDFGTMEDINGYGKEQK